MLALPGVARAFTTADIELYQWRERWFSFHLGGAEAVSLPLLPCHADDKQAVAVVMSETQISS
jgi:hypothetical protein